MATVVGITVPTLVDVAKLLDPTGAMASIAEILNQTNPILDDMPFYEGNLPTGNLTTIRTGLPAVAWRQLNAGVQPSKGTTAQVTEQAGLLESWSAVDVEVARISGNVEAFRRSEAMAHIEAMSQEAASVIFYGNSGLNPEKFMGLAPRYSAIAAAPGNQANIVDAGGTGSDNTSIWVVGWGPRTVHGIFPRGSTAGLQRNDRGIETVQTSSASTTSALMLAYREQFVWKLGLALEDWRYVVRIANIDVSNLVAESSAADLRKSLFKAIARIPNLSGVRPVIYANRTVATMLGIQAMNAVGTGGGLTFENFDGRRILQFQGIPVRQVDAILDTETRVV